MILTEKNVCTVTTTKHYFIFILFWIILSALFWTLSSVPISLLD